MKHLNPELERLEQRIAPGLMPDLGLHLMCNCCPGTSATDNDEHASSGASGSQGSQSGCSGTGSSKS